MINLRSLLVIVSIVCLSNLPTLAQSAGSNSTAQQQSIFGTLFISPSNNNGYEEFVRAVDLIKDVEEVEATTESGATLTFKRRVIAMPACVEALKLLREGLAKHVASPRVSLDENTLFPELQGFRKLARLLAAEQYVDFAEGQIDAAIESMRTGLAFGYLIQTDSLISGLIGIAIDAMVLKAFAAHIEQLSIYQCDSVLQIAKTLLQAENPGIRLMQQEKASILKALDKRRNDGAGLVSFISTGVSPSDTAQLAAIQRLTDQIAAQPAEVNSLIDAAKARVGALYDLAAANMQVPLAQRKPFPKEDTNTPVGALTSSVTVDPQKIIDKYSTDLAKIRLLAVHVLIRRYQWEHNTLPGALSELHADDLIVDPFTGDTITYKRDLDRYTLTSAGPFIQDDVSKQLTSVRNPVSLR